LANCSHVDSVLNDAIFDHIRFNDTALLVRNSLAPQEFTIFPNPASDEITIHFNASSSNKNITVQLMDVSGKIISSRKLVLTNTDVKIPLSKLPKGQYFLLIQGKQTSAVQFTKN
ncbi:MAG TPA: T9SS type A sorting domain-containing protein, partial [Chitinophagaceae bacterium]|nr:T9SS type A sorting domain-containing protein [Chitinophagaceae bacterium]